MKKFDRNPYPDPTAPPHALYLVGRDGVEERVTIANLDRKTVHAGIDAALQAIGQYDGILYAERFDGPSSEIMEYESTGNPTDNSHLYAVYVYSGQGTFGKEDIGRLVDDPLAQRLFEIMVDDAEEEYLQALEQVREIAGDSFDPSIQAVEAAIKIAYDASAVCIRFGSYDPREFDPDVIDALRCTPYRLNADGNVEVRLDVGSIDDHLVQQSEGEFSIRFSYSLDDERTWVSAKERVYVTDDGELFLDDSGDRLLDTRLLTHDQIDIIDVALEDALAWMEVTQYGLPDAVEA